MTVEHWRDAGAVIGGVCLLFAMLGCLYSLVAVVLVGRFFRRPRALARSVHHSVTILKPLHGDEPNLYENLSSFCAQDYPGPVQIVFGLHNRADPGLAVVERLIAAFPDRAIDVVVDAALHGSNRKVSNLINMSAAIRHEIVVVADSDMRVGPDYLSRIEAELEAPGVGGVTCLYHGEAVVPGVWSSLSALGINAHFLPNVIVGVALGLARPCFGSTIALRRQTLDEIGGFLTFADDLADDYEIGAALRRAGHEVAIPQFTVAHACIHRSRADLWRQELRWARTIRVLHPIGFAGTFLSYPLAWAALAAVLSGFHPFSLWTVAAALACRLLVCMRVERAFGLPVQPYWLIPIRDGLSFAGFFWSFGGGGVSWKGHDFHVLSDGTLIPERRSPLP